MFLLNFSGHNYVQFDIPVNKDISVSNFDGDAAIKGSTPFFIAIPSHFVVQDFIHSF
jgi:hypothetical protein